MKPRGPVATRVLPALPAIHVRHRGDTSGVAFGVFWIRSFNITAHQTICFFQYPPKTEKKNSPLQASMACKAKQVSAQFKHDNRQNDAESTVQ